MFIKKTSLKSIKEIDFKIIRKPCLKIYLNKISYKIKKKYLKVFKIAINQDKKKINHLKINKYIYTVKK